MVESKDLIRILLREVDEPNRSKCLAILDVLEQEPLASSPGSKHNHQTWQGGYLDHVAEVMQIAVCTFYGLNNIRDLPFTLSDALLIMFLHDLEKPWKYAAHHKIEKKDNHLFRLVKLKEFGIELTPDQDNALRYVEGENDDYTPGMRVMGPLAAFCHMCDVCSARIWFDQPSR